MEVTESRGHVLGLVTTVVVPPAPQVPELTAAQLKKNRDREYRWKKRALASRRSVGRVSDDEGSATTAGGRRLTKRVRIADDDWDIDSSAVHGSVGRICVVPQSHGLINCIRL